MTREEFIKGYAKRSNLSDNMALIGLIDTGLDGWKMIALPCACEAASCEGWAMISIEGLDHHLSFNAPDELRNAYRKLTT